MDLLKNVFSLGLGAAASTKEQIEKAVDSLVKKAISAKKTPRSLLSNGSKKGNKPKSSWMIPSRPKSIKRSMA
ncbi:hypothetical protein Q5O89_11920 [Peribacillus frigoritolerans]|nr:hypothetical protein [Peribacillus frigoritolerans]